MCHGNLAHASAHFINAQLLALWENSKACNDKESGKKDFTDIVTKHGIALREFYGPQNEESGSTSFHAIFQAPHIEFLCNHELMLLLKVKSGQYQVKKSSISLKNTTLAVRLSYHFEDLSAALDGKQCTISVLSFKTSSAMLIPESCVFTEGHSHDFDALSLLFKNHYIPTLMDAGNLNLLVLSPLYAGKREIDHGITISRILPRPLLFDIQVERLNRILDHHWLAAISYHDANKGVSVTLRDTYLAQYKTSWLGGELWATYEFSPLKLQVLCETEVIIFFKANIRVFHDEAETRFDSELNDWEIAVIFQVTHKHNRVLLDRFYAPRIAPHLCTLPCQQLEDNFDEMFRNEFKKSILHGYIDLIFLFGHYQLYPDFHKPSEPISPDGHEHGPEPSPKPTPDHWHHHRRPTLPVGPYPPGGSDPSFTIEWETLWEKFVKETSLHGHHQLISVTQAGINAHLLALWQKAKNIVKEDSEIHKNLSILVHFDSKKYNASGNVTHLPHYSCNFGAPQIEFVAYTGSKHVIVYFFIQSISFELSKKTHQFKDWILAFQFDLKLISSSTTGFQLILDPTTAVLLHHRSSFGSLVETKETHIIRSLYGSLSTNFIERYIKAFVDAGEHVLYTIPISSLGDHAHGVADIDFAVVPFSLSSFHGRIFQGLWGSAHHIVERNMIIFYTVVKGASAPPRPLPGPFGSPSPHPPHGTVLLSRERFLETYILKPLTKVNALTTILCNFQGVDKSNWNVTLETWATSAQRVDNECQWELDGHHNNSLRYKWENCEEWHYEAHGTGITVGTYTVTANTLNRLSIPTTTRSGPLVMQLEGECSVSMNYRFHQQRHWFGTLKATWKTPIELVSESGRGLSIKCDEQIKVVFEKDSKDHTDTAFTVGRSALESVDERFRAAFNSSINVAQIIKGVNESFSGIYKGLALPHAELVLANPVFTAHGDLVLQLLIKTELHGKGASDSGSLGAISAALNKRRVGSQPSTPQNTENVIEYLNTLVPPVGRTPALQAIPGYNPNTDVEKLKEALKGVKTDVKLLIETLTPLSAMHLAVLSASYRTSTGKELLTAIESGIGRKLSDYLTGGGREKTVLTALVRGPIGYDAQALHEVLSSSSVDEFLAELLADRSPSDLQHLGQAYKIRYGKGLEDAVKSDLSGKAQELFTAILSSKRTPDDAPVDKALVEADVKALYEASQGKANEVAFYSIIINRSRPHLTALWEAYVHQHGKTLSKVIKDKFIGITKTTLLYFVTAANPKRVNEGAAVWRDAKLLEDTMVGMGTKDDLLVRRLLRQHWDQVHFAKVRKAYETKYKQSLESRVAGETSGDYQKAVVGLVKVHVTISYPATSPASASGFGASGFGAVSGAASGKGFTTSTTYFSSSSSTTSLSLKNGSAVEGNGQSHPEHVAPATPKTSVPSTPATPKTSVPPTPATPTTGVPSTPKEKKPTPA